MFLRTIFTLITHLLISNAHNCNKELNSSAEKILTMAFKNCRLIHRGKAGDIHGQHQLFHSNLFSENALLDICGKWTSQVFPLSILKVAITMDKAISSISFFHMI